MFRKLTLALVAAASLSADGAGSHLRFGGWASSGRIIITTTTGVTAIGFGVGFIVAAAMTAAT